MANETKQKAPRRYEKMRDSGVEWIGMVPEEWKVVKMKSIFRPVSIKNHPDAEVLSLYRDLGVLPKDSRDDNHNVTSEDASQYKYVQKGNLVINKMKAWQGSLAVSSYNGIVSPAYYVCEFRLPSVDKRYFHHLLRCAAYAQEFERLSTGMRIGQWDLGIDDFLRVPALLPPFDTQKQIGCYLDEMCSRIDDVITEAKASIEEYKAWKSSIIYEAVTKGLDPTAEMKDSGAEWIGKIPQNWRYSKIKYVCSMQAGKNITAEQITRDGQYPVYGGNGFRGFYTSYNHEGKYLLVGRQGALCGNVHRVHGKFWATEHAIVTENSDKVDYNYLYYLLIAMNLNQYASQTAAQPGLAVNTIGNLQIYLPPVPLQIQISNHIEFLVSQIDVLIQEKNALISDLESYKKSLIYEVVTGKRKVV